MLIDITESIAFNTIADVTESTFVLSIRDVYSAPGTDNVLSNSPVTSTLNINGSSNDAYHSWGQFGNFGGAPFSGSNFYGLYFFNSDQSVSIGDSLEITPGLVRLAKYFNTAGAALPDLPSSEVQLFSLNTRVPISGPVSLASAIPEPSSMALLTVGMGGFWIRRRKCHQKKLS